MTTTKTPKLALTISLAAMALFALAVPAAQAGGGDHSGGQCGQQGQHEGQNNDGDCGGGDQCGQQGQHEGQNNDGDCGNQCDGQSGDGQDGANDGKDKSKEGKDQGDDGCGGGHCGGADQCPPKLECPTDLKAVANADKSVTLTFKMGKGSEGSNVYRQDGGKGQFKMIQPLDDETSFTDKTTKEGKSYTYMVTGVKGGDEVKPCPKVEVTAIPEFPTVMGLGLATGGGALAMVLGRRRKP